MAAGRYGVSLTLDEAFVERLGSKEEVMRYIESVLSPRLGAELVPILLETGRSVVELKLQTEIQPYLFQIRCALIADICPTRIEASHQVVDWLYTKVDPLGNSTLPLEWQCAYCGQVNLYESHLDCRKCGAPRKRRV